MAAPVPANESARIAALRSYDVLDSEPEPQFDALVKLAAHIAGAPIAMLSLIDADRQWFKACHGIDSREASRETSLCAHVVAADAPLIVEDAHADERFVDNPHVTGDPRVRFYAGMPLRTDDGFVLGTLCTIDRKPRQLTSEQLDMLALLARQTVELLEARRRHIALATFRKTLDRTQDAILIFEQDTLKCSYANEGATRLLGYTREHLKTMTPFDLVLESEHPRMREALDTGASEGAPVITFDTLYRDGAGRDTPIEVFLQYIAGEDGHDGRWVNIVRDITERKRIEQLQSEFIATVSHELRTPLTSIRGSLGLVAGGVTGAMSDEAKEFISIALTNSDRLVRLINDILDVERMASGKIEFRIRSLELPALLEQTLAALQPTAAGYGSRIVTTTQVPDIEIAVDPDRFAQVITNIVGNAAKFSPAGTPVEVSTIVDGSIVRISIRDHGPGIPAEFRGRVFHRFAQADPSATRTKGGTGLGLSISKAIVDRLGGTIRFEDASGGGTQFIVELPALPLPGASLDTGPRVLVCEDDPHVYRMIERILRAEGFAVDIAPTLERARRLLAAGTPYAAVTLDLVLADGDGTELLPELSREGHELPVIVVSGSNRDLGRAAILVTDVIAKPFREDRLLDAIRRAVTSKPAPRILHVEDDEDLRKIVRRTLPAEWHVTGAESVHRARKLLADESYDVVVIDLGLPDGSGADLIPHAGSARVIIFSAKEVSAELSRRVSAALVKTRTSADDLRVALATLIGKDSTR